MRVNTRVLLTLVVCYLALPVCLFMFSWIRFPLNICILLATTYTIYRVFRQPTTDAERLVGIPYGTILALALLALFVGVVSGAGAFIFQRGDWTKHNVVLNDLIRFAWPVQYGPSAYVSDTTLVYYLAYYLPAVLVGKVLGWRAAELALFAYTVLGTLLFVTWLRIRSESGLRGVLLFFMISGLDVVGYLLTHAGRLDIAYLETYTHSLQFPSQISQITWVPQHTIVGWLLALCVYESWRSKSWSAIPLLSGVALLWSPFVAVGVCIISLPYVVKDLIRSHNTTYIISIIICAVLVFVTITYYQSRLPILQDHLSLYWITYSSFGLTRLTLNMLLFLVLELVVFIPLLFIRAHPKRSDVILALWVMVTLVIITQFTYGAANDWAMRASMPGITLLAIILIPRLIQALTRRNALTYYAGMIILIGAVTPLSQLIVLKDVSNPATNERPDVDMRFAHEKYGVIHQQYMGSASRWFGRYLGNYPQIPDKAVH